MERKGVEWESEWSGKYWVITRKKRQEDRIGIIEGKKERSGEREVK